MLAITNTKRMNEEKKNGRNQNKEPYEIEV
jgi:hypothetical protein